MYMQIMGRHVDSQGLSAQQQGIAGNGVCGRPRPVALVLSTEARSKRIGGYYQLYLRRSVDQSGLMYWLNQYRQGFQR